MTQTKEQVNAQRRAYREANKEKIKAYKASRYQLDKKNAQRRAAAWAKANPEKHRATQRKCEWRRAGIPFPTRPMPEVCEACGKPPSGRDKVLCNDHEHLTNTFRGWLCRRCNRVLGMLDDNSDLCISLAKYLRSHQL